MNKVLRKPVIAGNWKMNKNQAETIAFINELLPEISDLQDVKIVLCVPFTDLSAAVSAVLGTCVSIGAQNVHYSQKGAFTGEISVSMLAEIGVEYVIIGHSERRQYFGETDRTVKLRTSAALEAGLKVILCIGETLDERNGNLTDNVVNTQLAAALDGISAEAMDSVIIAYEPVWAIGTGLNATDEQAEQVCGYIRDQLALKYGSEVSDKTVIQYGGSMKSSNAAGLLAMPDIDGGLIGTASLEAKEFLAIIKSAK